MRVLTDPRMLPSVLLALIANFPAHWPWAQSFLSDKLVLHNQVQNVLEHQPVKYTTCQQKLTGPIETTLCDYETVESVNDELFTQLHDLVQTPFFKYFQVDLYRDCPFWDDDDRCANKDCSVTPVDESNIPEKWRAATLSKVREPSAELKAGLPGCYYRDSDYCFLDDSPDGEYIDLSANPERFTGYSGPSAHRIWSSIYQENCFGLAEFQASTASSTSHNPLLKMAPPPKETVSSDECLEKRVYYKIISGLHASISTHLCYDYFFQDTEEWGPNLQCFVSRVASHPERLQYIYFNTVLLLRAVARIGPYLSAYDICTGNEAEEVISREKLSRVIEIAERAGKFDESVLFNGQDAAILREEFKIHFRNVSEIMNCVGCQRCRLWGKVQVSGVGTALKILFELDELALDPKANPNLLQRSEVVALINTLHRFTESLHAVDEFRRLWAEAEEKEAMIKQSEKEKRAESATNPSPPSPSALTGRVTGTSRQPSTAYEKVVQFAQICKRSTTDGVQACLRVVLEAISTITSIFKLSGKDGLPRPDL